MTFLKVQSCPATTLQFNMSSLRRKGDNEWRILQQILFINKMVLIVTFSLLVSSPFPSWLPFITCPLLLYLCMISYFVFSVILCISYICFCDKLCTQCWFAWYCMIRIWVWLWDVHWFCGYSHIHRRDFYSMTHTWISLMPLYLNLKRMYSFWI